MLIGTAGHIDHGKTSLIRRLTGRNTDRLPEEQKRGISIELGYAYVPTEGGDVIGFIDVPGHEKFVHTMLAGATGIDRALLVVAADDGVMPQTQEHLDILRLLGVDQGAIALTKVDAVAPARVVEVQAQLAAALGAPADGWPVFPLSNVSGEGVYALDAWLRAQAGLQRAFGAQALAGVGHLACDARRHDLRQPLQHAQVGGHADVDFLHRYTARNNKSVDLAGRIVYNDKNQEVFNFGKHKGKEVEWVLRNERSYYDWMMQGDFPQHTKLKLTEIFHKVYLKK